MKPPGLSFLPFFSSRACTRWPSLSLAVCRVTLQTVPCYNVRGNIFPIFIILLFAADSVFLMVCMCVSYTPSPIYEAGALTDCVCVFSSYRRAENVQLQLELKESHNMQLVFITSPLVHWSIITFWLHPNLSMTSAVLSDTLAAPRTHSLAYKRTAMHARWICVTATVRCTTRYHMWMHMHEKNPTYRQRDTDI